MRVITVLIVGVLFCEANHAATKIDPADSRICYMGRWEFSNPSSPWCAWQGSSITARFRGSAVQAEIESGSRPVYIRVIIDGNAAESRKIKLLPGQQTYTLASGLDLSEHQIEIIKDTYAGEERMTFYGFVVTGGGLVEMAETQPPLKIEFYGDSNLAGVSLEHEKNEGSSSLRGSYYSLAGIASRALNADYHNLSSSGAIIAGRLNSGLSFHDRVDFFHAEPRWNFDKFPADICVVNLGANDITNKSKDQIKKDYKTLVSAIRNAHPDAHIVLMNGYGWSRDEPANYTQEVVAEMGDAKLSRVVFPWLFNEWHGCEYDHAGMAQTLLDHLASLNPKWKQVRPIDVMDGFGRNGTVANGSFEFVAPFGGYGWRYYTDGAQRIHDPDDSPDGQWFLRLPEGKQVHQPNRASRDNTYAFELQMRGREAGDQAHILIEFRDQEWRHEIPDSSKTFAFELGTAWKDYTVSVKSPAGVQPPDASRDPWQIIIRLKAHSGRVDFDAIRLSSADAQIGHKESAQLSPAQ